MGTFEQFIEESGLEEIKADILSVRKELVGFTPIGYQRKAGQSVNSVSQCLRKT